MNKKTYLTLTAVVFSVVGLMHLLRIFTGFTVLLGGVVVPLWASWLGVLVAGLLAVSGFRLAGK
ncbi:MAG TPA: hypothetical protein VJA87_01855 [Candidatus Paceibacterota bacterium]